MPDRVIDDGVKIQALPYLSVGLKAPQVSSIVKISESQLYRLKKKQLSAVGEVFRPLRSSYPMYKMHLDLDALLNRLPML